VSSRNNFCVVHKWTGSIGKGGWGEIAGIEDGGERRTAEELVKRVKADYEIRKE
jgi:hypothetical protein